MTRPSSHDGPRAPRAPRSALVAVLLLATLSCGASIQAVYEGDVRFEHCMALDSHPDVKPAIPSACWEEWLQFYTFGQTRDRIEHARTRAAQLSAASDFSESEWRSQKKLSGAAAPDPTSVLMPPPMLLAMDGGASSSGASVDSGADADAAEDAALPASDCTIDCERAYGACRKDCKVQACEKACATKYKRCMKRCF